MKCIFFFFDFSRCGRKLCSNCNVHGTCCVYKAIYSIFHLIMFNVKRARFLHIFLDFFFLLFHTFSLLYFLSSIAVACCEKLISLYWNECSFSNIYLLKWNKKKEKKSARSIGIHFPYESFSHSNSIFDFVCSKLIVSTHTKKKDEETFFLRLNWDISEATLQSNIRFEYGKFNWFNLRKW